MGLFTGVAAEMRRFSEAEMPDTVTIRSYAAPTVGEGGGQVPGAPTETGTNGRIAPLSSLSPETERMGQLAQDGVEVLHVPLTASVGGSDRIVVESARHGTTTEYTVEGVMPLGSFAVDRTVLVKPA